MRKLIPLLAVVLLLCGLGVYYGPGIYRTMVFKRDSAGLLEKIREGDTKGIVSFVEKGQQHEISGMFTAYLPAAYNSHIQSIKRTNFTVTEDGDIYSLVIVRIDTGINEGIYQGNLHWTYADGHWWWDVKGSSGAVYSPTGSPAWVKLVDLIPLAKVL